MEANRIYHRENADFAYLVDDGTFPNNPRFPLLRYRNVVSIQGPDPAAIFERLFNDQGWAGSWRDGVYDMHHYHSTAHEVLGVYSGTAVVQFGGEQGICVEVQAGDVAVIPAGVAHKRLHSSGDFRVVGAYPPGQNWDMNYGKKGERPEADLNIAGVALPPTDPVYGSDGFLMNLWKIL